MRVWLTDNTYDEIAGTLEGPREGTVPFEQVVDGVRQIRLGDVVFLRSGDSAPVGS